jgi:hypothetical protein
LLPEGEPAPQIVVQPGGVHRIAAESVVIEDGRRHPRRVLAHHEACRRNLLDERRRRHDRIVFQRKRRRGYGLPGQQEKILEPRTFGAQSIRRRGPAERLQNPRWKEDAPRRPLRPVPIDQTDEAYDVQVRERGGCRVEEEGTGGMALQFEGLPFDPSPDGRRQIGERNGPIVVQPVRLPQAGQPVEQRRAGAQMPLVPRHVRCRQTFVFADERKERVDLRGSGQRAGCLLQFSRSGSGCTERNGCGRVQPGRSGRSHRRLVELIPAAKKLRFAKPGVERVDVRALHGLACFRIREGPVRRLQQGDGGAPRRLRAHERQHEIERGCDRLGCKRPRVQGLKRHVRASEYLTCDVEVRQRPSENNGSPLGFNAYVVLQRADERDQFFFTVPARDGERGPRGIGLGHHQKRRRTGRPY